MSLEEVLEAVKGFSQDEQDKLSAALDKLRMESEGAELELLKRRLDDHAPGHWLSLEEFKRQAVERYGS